MWIEAEVPKELKRRCGKLNRYVFLPLSLSFCSGFFLFFFFFFTDPSSYSSSISLAV